MARVLKRSAAIKALMLSPCLARMERRSYSLLTETMVEHGIRICLWRIGWINYGPWTMVYSPWTCLSCNPKTTLMQTGLLHLHNLLRWIILILLLVSIFKAYSGWQSKKAFAPGDKKVWLFTMIAAHTTLLLGLYQVAFGRFGFVTTSLPEGTSVMKDKFFRFYWIEHPVGML